MNIRYINDNFTCCKWYLDDEEFQEFTENVHSNNILAWNLMKKQELYKILGGI